MSLISEALKKARLESGEGEERLPYVTRPAPPKRRAPLWPWLVASISLSLAGGIVVGALFLRANGTETGSSSSPSPPPGSSRPEIPAAIEPGSSPIGSETRGPDSSRDEGAGIQGPQGTSEGPPAGGEDLPAVQEPREASEGESVPPGSKVRAETTAGEPAPTASSPEKIASQSRSETLGVEPTPETPPDRRVATVTPGTRGSERLSAGPEPGSSHHRRITLPDGSEIALGGIAISAGTAAVLVNGEVLAPGDGRDGWRLVRAETGRVEIEWEGVRFFLEL